MIVDASVALAWVLGDERSEYADRILDQLRATEAAAPAHWTLEIANGLLSAHRAGRIDDDGVADASQLLDRLPIELVPVPLTTATWTVFATARDHNLSTYDAAYLDLARFRGVPLATLDGRLRAACAGAGVDVA